MSVPFSAPAFSPFPGCGDKIDEESVKIDGGEINAQF